MPERLSGIAVAEATAGFVLLWSGVKGQTVAMTLKALLKGQSPPAAVMDTPKIGVGSAGGPGGSQAPPGPAGPGGATGSSIADQALKYKGTGYVWGGAPASGAGHWDCSSFVNWVIGHDLRMAIPGYAAGAYDGKAHGPITYSWLAWSGATTVGHSGKAAAAGDLCCWPSHMGIAIGGGQMISAENPADGTKVSGIDGFIPEPLAIRRLK